MEKRKYNIDLLRIISIIFIILSHYVYHGNIVDNSTITGNIWVALLVSVCGKLGANIFILISGYFYKENKLKFSKIIKMDLKVIFYSILICVVFKFFNIREVTLKNWVSSIIPLISGLYWFFTAYIGLYLISPVLNYLIHNVESKILKKIIIYGFVLLSIIPTFTSFDPWYSDIIWFIYVYIVGAYIRLNEENKYKKYYKIIALLFSVIIFALTLSIYYISMRIHALKAGIYHFTAITSSFLFGLAVLYLLIFKDIKINNNTFNKIIKSITPHLLYVYILHDNPLIRDVLWDLLKCKEMSNSAFMVVNMIISVIIIFVVSIIIDMIVDVAFNKIKFNKIEEILSKIKLRMNLEK